MVRRIKKDSHESEIKRRNFILSMFILVIMVSSIVGFALMNGGGNVSGDPNEIPKELDFKQVEQNGQTFWVAIKNHEMFVFENIDGFDDRSDLSSLASQIKTKNEIKIYVDPSFESADARFMVDKVLRGLQIPSSINLDGVCDENTLYLTNNATSVTGNCMKFVSKKGEEYSDANILVYHLVK